MAVKQLILLKNNYDYCNTWNLKKITISQGKTYVEYKAGKNASYDLMAMWAGCKSEMHGIV